MSFPRYPKYKDSGVEWLGEVPEHWDVQRLKRICRVFPSNVDKKTVEGEAAVLLCNYTDVYYNDRIVSDMDFMPATATDDQIGKFTLRAGDTIITKDSETADDIAVAAYVPHDLPGVVCGYHLSMVRPREGVNGAFVKRLFDSTYAKSCFAVRANGLTRVGLSQYELDNVDMPVPPSAEQAAIATFLDRETAKIDALIAEQQRLIELLQEKRQAVISHAVTKGLNPDAPMKDSEIDWLGEVPEHWVCSRLKHLIARGTSVSYGIVQPGEPLDEGVPFVQTTNMSSGDFGIESLQMTTPAIANQYPRSTLSGGEVLLGIRASIGAAHVAPITLRGANLSRGVARIAPSSVISSEFLVAVLRADATSTYWKLAQQGSTFNEVSIATVRDLPVVVPPRDEQEHIVESLGHRNGYFEELIADAQTSTSLLQERRSALISAAVTGQIDLRGLAGSQAP